MWAQTEGRANKIQKGLYRAPFGIGGIGGIGGGGRRREEEEEEEEKEEEEEEEEQEEQEEEEDFHREALVREKVVRGPPISGGARGELLSRF